MTVSQTAAWAALAFFPPAMVLAAVMDVLTLTIRNRLVLIIIIGYGVLAPLAGIPPHEMAWSAAVAAGVLGLGFALFSMGWIGGGDAKLAAATVLWLGTDQLFPYLLYTALLGGVLTLAILAFRRLALPASSLPSWMERLHRPATGVPYGAAMAPAALMVFPHTPWMAALL